MTQNFVTFGIVLRKCVGDGPGFVERFASGGVVGFAIGDLGGFQQGVKILTEQNGGDQKKGGAHIRIL